MCLRAPEVEFLPSLLGGSLHPGANVRFNIDTASSSASQEKNTSKDDEPQKICEKTLEDSSKLEGFTLNATQQRVVVDFLSSSSSTIKKNQGSLGTGKFESQNTGQKRRIMVCAPSNFFLHTTFIFICVSFISSLLPMCCLAILCKGDP